jgi:hypothetical protein
LAALQANQPDRFAALITAKANIERTRLGLAQVTEQQTQYRRAAAAQQAQALGAWRQQQVADFEGRAKRLAPQTWTDTRARNDAALQTLRAAGASDHEIAQISRGPGWVSLHSAAAQEILLKAAMWDNAQAKAKEVKKLHLPPVQRPGMARPAGASAAERIGKLQGQLANVTGRKALEIGAEIQKLRRGMQ